MATAASLAGAAPPAVVRPPRERIGVVAARRSPRLRAVLGRGIGLCVIALGIVLFMLIEGLSDLRLSLLVRLARRRR